MTSSSAARNLTSVALPDDARQTVFEGKKRGEVVGLVPTMGALHAGHMSLIRAARDECDLLVVSIFVNPTQFGPHEDYGRYPRPFETDLSACAEAGVDLVFAPDVPTMYPENYGTHVDVEPLSGVLEGEFRPGHFRGVATVVLKLFNCVTPDVAYFGLKDYQQQLVIRRLCRDLNVPVAIRTSPIVREADGLALSSRNQYLDPEQRKSALALSRSLELAAELLASGEQNLAIVREAMRSHLEGTPRVRVDYATVADPETLEEPTRPLPEMIALVAAHVDDVRLIDNRLIRL